MLAIALGILAGVLSIAVGYQAVREKRLEQQDRDFHLDLERYDIDK